MSETKDKNRRESFKSWLNFLTFSLILGILILSLGVYLVGIHFQGGNIVLMVGSFIIYIVAIILAFKV